MNKMKNILRCLGIIILIIVVIILMVFMFFIIKYIDIIFYNTLYANEIKPAGQSFITSFDGYRDFVTVITGLLTLIMGFTGLAAIFSYRQLAKKAEEFEKNNEKSIKLLRKLNIYPIMLKANILLTSEQNMSSAVDVFNSAEYTTDVEPMYHKLEGDAYYYRGEDGDYEVAIICYKKALILNGTLNSAWFGIGLAKYKSACKIDNKYTNMSLDYDVENVKFFVLSNNHESTKDIKLVEEAISDIEKSVSYGYNKVQAFIAMADMYKAIGDYGKSLSNFKKAFDLNQKYLSCGFSYCYLWVVINQENIQNEEHCKDASVDEVIKILKAVGFYDIINSKAAYALLWYLYSLVPGLGSVSDAKYAFDATDKYTINDLFRYYNRSENYYVDPQRD